uniref:SSD domain-containing protein n=1 Tax=Amphora coffeiformis TaxID=265554 RepID=A0A7S3KY13_9STRA
MQRWCHARKWRKTNCSGIFDGNDQRDACVHKNSNNSIYKEIILREQHCYNTIIIIIIIMIAMWERYDIDNEADSDRKVHTNDLYAGDSTSDNEVDKKEATFWSDEEGNLKFVNLVVRRPCCIFCTQIVLLLIMTFLLMISIAQQGQPFSDPETEADLNDIRSIRYDSYRLAQEQVENSRQNEVTPRQSKLKDYTYWIWEAETPAGVFGSRTSIAAMKEAFDLFLEDNQWDQYCFLQYPNPLASDNNITEPFCDKPLTALNFYYAAEWNEDLINQVLVELKTPGNIARFNSLVLCYAQGLFCDLIEDSNITITDEDVTWALELNNDLQEITSQWDMTGELVPNITQATELAAYLNQVDSYKGFVDFGFDKEFSVDNLVSHYSRGILLWGGPLEVRSTDLTPDEVDDQDADDSEQRREYVVDNFLDEMERLAEGGTHDEINSYFFMEAIIFDILIEIVIRDGLLAIFSLMFVFIWLRINTGSWFLSAVGIFEIFISIPVAWFFFSVVFQIKYFAFLNALTIFIVAAIGADDIFIFMDAYKQSKYRHPENLVSLETRMTWVYRRTGQAMAITSATTCAAFLCTLITPLVSIQSFGIFAAFVIFIDYAFVMSLFCTSVVIYHNRFEDRSCWGCCCTNCTITSPTPTCVAKEALESGESEEHVDRVGEFFRTKVAGFIKVPWHRAVIAVVFVCWVAQAVYLTTQIEAIKETEQFLDEDHPLQKSITILNNEFPVADDDLALRVHYVWGVGEVDRSGVRLLFDPEFYGEPVFREGFDFNEQCQTEMVSACEKLRSDPKYRGLIKQNGGVGRVFCFMEELAAYNVKGDLADCEYVFSGGYKNETWQVPPDQLASLMDGFLEQRSCNEDTETVESFYSNELGWDGEYMKYAAFSVESENLQPFSQEPEAVTRAEYDQFIAIARELEQSVSKACGGEVMTTDLDGIFIFMNNQSIYVRNAVQASLLGVIIAFVVLLLTTKVLHVAFLASISIISVLVSVTGTMMLLGWDLGAIESILIGIIAGFSVDYVVHLAHAYESADGDTDERITTAFGDMGISVFNGMVTSVAAAVPLFLCQLQFFAKFATFLCTTIAFSWIFANFAFMSALAQFKIPIKKEGWRL